MNLSACISYCYCIALSNIIWFVGSCPFSNEWTHSKWWNGASTIITAERKNYAKMAMNGGCVMHQPYRYACVCVVVPPFFCCCWMEHHGKMIKCTLFVPILCVISEHNNFSASNGRAAIKTIHEIKSFCVSDLLAAQTLIQKARVALRFLLSFVLKTEKLLLQSQLQLRLLLLPLWLMVELFTQSSSTQENRTSTKRMCADFKKFFLKNKRRKKHRFFSFYFRVLCAYTPMH